jgi:hypothetical protein
VLDARVGKQGSLHVRGGLPFAPSASSQPLHGEGEATTTTGQPPPLHSGIHIDAKEIEVKVRNVYSGEHNLSAISLEFQQNISKTLFVLFSSLAFNLQRLEQGRENLFILPFQ